MDVETHVAKAIWVENASLVVAAELGKDGKHQTACSNQRV
jgi:hypothetical protein